MPCDPSKVCQICDQRGLPILPLRYAVARPDVKRDHAPQLSAPFGAGVEDIVLPTKDAQYTLRLLRSGYLYVFNEVRGDWKAYVVNEQAYLTEFDIHDRTPPDVSGAEPCERMQNSAAGRCVMIPDATRAGAVWLGFSDVAWTADVLKRNSKQASREKHMQRIEVGEWASNGAPQPHVDKLERIPDLVSEFAINAPESVPLTDAEKEANARADSGTSDERPVILQTVTVTNYPCLDFSIHDYRNEQSGELEFVGKAAAAAGGIPPAMVALHDPVGVTSELATLLSLRFESFMRQSAKSRELMVSASIDQLEMVIKEDAENRKIYRTEREAHQALDAGYMGMGDGGGAARGGQALLSAWVPAIKKRRDDAFERMRNPTAQQLFAARGESWGKYQKKYDEPRRRAWQNQWESRARAFDQNVIVPLAKAHRAWVSSEQLCDKFDGSCDDADARSGEGFVMALTLCIQDTQQFRICFDVYRDWISAAGSDRRNLVLRGLAHNQKTVLAQLDNATQGGLRADALEGLPWDGLIASYEKSLAALGNGGKSAIVTLTAAIGGPISDMFAKAVDGVVGPGLVAMGLVAKAPVVLVTNTMSKADAITELVAKMSAINGKVSSLKDLNSAIDIEMRKAQIYGVSVEGKGRFRYLVMADPQVIADFPGDVSKGGARRLAEASILTELDRSKLTRSRWKQLMPTNARLGIITGLLQVMAWRKLAEDLDTSMAHERRENAWRYHSGMAAMSGTIAETVGKWSDNASSTGNRLAVTVERYLGKALRIIGKGIGIGAGIVMAFWDGIKGLEELRHNNGIGWLYLGSAFAGIGAMLAFSGLGAWLLGAAATGVGIILVVLVIVIAVLIEVFKDDRIQDWLERCVFGTFDLPERYPDAAVELEQLQIAVQG